MKISSRSTREVQEAIRQIFKVHFPFSDRDDLLVLGEGPSQYQITYVSKRASGNSQDLTRVELSFPSDSNEMWIRWLGIAASQRSLGLGLKLAQTAEKVAFEMGIRNILVFPLFSAFSFWKKIGYLPHPRMARVLCKDLSAYLT